MPAAYDVDNEVETPEEYKLQQSQNEMLSDNGKRLVQRVIEECIKIVKLNERNGEDSVCQKRYEPQQRAWRNF